MIKSPPSTDETERMGEVNSCDSHFRVNRFHAQTVRSLRT
jgi:hypothetical protein